LIDESIITQNKRDLALLEHYQNTNKMLKQVQHDMTAKILYSRHPEFTSGSLF